MEYVYEWIEKIVEKGDNAGYQHYLLFPQYHQKPFFRAIKAWNAFVKDYLQYRCTEAAL